VASDKPTILDGHGKPVVYDHEEFTKGFQLVKEVTRLVWDALMKQQPVNFRIHVGTVRVPFEQARP
jgi:hypothetical protein